MGSTNIRSNNKELLYWIERHDFVTIEQVAKIKTITKQSACALLNRLVEAELLEKYRPLPSEACPFFFFVTPKAKEVILEYHDDVEPGELILRRKNEVSRVSLNNIWHAKVLNDYVATLFMHSWQSNEFPGLVDWSNSRESHLYLMNANEGIIPDGTGLFDNGIAEIEFCFEMDRETMPLTRILDKYRKYFIFMAGNNIWGSFNAYPRIMFLTLRKDWAFKIKVTVGELRKRNW